MLIGVGLGYLGLYRSMPTLSRGESQRLRLATALISPLEDMLHVLDEPTVGQHPTDVERFLPVLRELPGPVVYVEHDAESALAADRIVDLGPGAGDLGGEVVYAGGPRELLETETATGIEFRRTAAGTAAVEPSTRDRAEAFVVCHEADVRTLQAITVRIPVGRLTVIAGVSGSGKSTFVEEVLCPSVAANLPVGCARIETPRLKTVLVDQAPKGPRNVVPLVANVRLIESVHPDRENELCEVKDQE